MKWITATAPPDQDTRCFIACRRQDGTIYISGYKGDYTIGLQRTVGSSLYVGFLQPNVIAWLPVPSPYTHNKRGWNLLREREPDKNGEYIVSTYNQFGAERVELAIYDAEKLKFYRQPDAIAWMPVPKVKTA